MCCCNKQIESDCISMKTNDLPPLAPKFAYKRNPVLDTTKPPKRPIRSLEEQVWDIVRFSDVGLSVRDVRRQVVGEITYNRVKAWLDKWQTAGYVTRMADTNVYPSTYLYEIVHDCGQQPPQVDGNGAVKKQSGNDIVWRTARILKNFNARQIMASANDGDTTLNEKAVRQYLLNLYDAGYITWVNANDPQKIAQYSLTVNTGPKAPEVQRGKKIYDGNLGMIVYDPAKPLPPSHQAEQNDQKNAKQKIKGARHV